VAATVLAVDDSVTMRKVLDITFAGPDFRCVTANSADAALQKLRSDKPDVVVADVTLEGKNGYELCRAIKQASPETPVLILSSKHNPYDPAKGSSAQADDYMDKPFDTQQMIDKVKKLLAAKGEVKAKAAPLPTAPVAQRARTLTYSAATGGSLGGNTPGPAPVAPAVRAPAVAAAVATPATGMPLQARSAARDATPVSPAAPPARTPAAPAVAPVAAAVAGPVNGQMAAKLADIGLTPAQVDAVLALSRDVVERVVWEVVPVLAETIIKEEIARLTK
jgi:CheY-like chemotaxis protein